MLMGRGVSTAKRGKKLGEGKHALRTFLSSNSPRKKREGTRGGIIETDAQTGEYREPYYVLSSL